MSPERIPAGPPAEAPGDHVLLIGIDAYDGCTPLRGCVNDIDAVQRLLIDRLHVAPARITRLAAPFSATRHEVDEGIVEKAPTLDNIRAELDRLGKNANPGDRVLIYYSGHGTQVKVVEPDTGTTFVREALVPKDHVVNLVEQQYLFDWELNELLSVIATRTSHVLCVLDACCSRGATRDLPGDARSQARYIEPARTGAPLVDKAPPAARGDRGIKRGLSATVQTCQVVAACLDDERARESDDSGGVRHGELTRALLKQLGEIPDKDLPDVRWGRIWYGLLADVAGANPAQHPWISDNLARRVVCGPPEDGDAGYAVTRDGDVYRLQVGSLFGVTKGAKLQVYASVPPRLPAVGSAQDRALHPHSIVVTSATPSTAEAAPIGAPFKLEPGARARLVKAGEAARLRLGIFPEDAAVRAALEQAAPGAPVLFEVVGESETSDVSLLQRSNGSWALVDSVFGTGEPPDEPWLAVVPANALRALRRIVEHYYWYSLPLRVAKSCRDLPEALRVTVHDAAGASALSAADAQSLDRYPELPSLEEGSYVVRAGEDEKSAVPACFAIRNRAAQPLLVALLACNNSGRVLVLSETKIPAGGAHVFWDGDTLRKAFLIDRLPGRKVCLDHIVAIGTTNLSASLRHLELGRSFEEILEASCRGGDDKELISSQRNGLPPELWTSHVATLRVVPR